MRGLRCIDDSSAHDAIPAKVNLPIADRALRSIPQGSALKPAGVKPAGVKPVFAIRAWLVFESGDNQDKAGRSRQGRAMLPLRERLPAFACELATWGCRQDWNRGAIVDLSELILASPS